MRVNQAPSMLPLFTPQPHIPATGVSQTIIKQDQEKCETRANLWVPKTRPPHAT